MRCLDREQAARFLALAREQLEAAGTGDWPRFCSLAIEREALLGEASLPAERMGAEAAREYVDILRAVAELDREIGRRAAAARDDMAAGLRLLRAGRDFLGAYARIERGVAWDRYWAGRGVGSGNARFLDHLR